MSQAPSAGYRRPRLGQNFRVFDRDLVGQVIHSGPRDPLHDVFLVAVEPARKVIPSPFVDSDGVNDECVAFPMRNALAIECGIRVLAMWSAVRWDNAEIVVQLVELDELRFG